MLTLRLEVDQLNLTSLTNPNTSSILLFKKFFVSGSKENDSFFYLIIR